MAKPVKIAFLADESDLVRGLDKGGAALGGFGTEAKAAGDKAESALSGVGDKADALGGASSQAAGGIGDLGGALSLMPGPLGAVGAGMEAAAPAIMGVTGAADLLNLATTKFPALAKLQTVATNTMAGAQRALNAVMAGNPIALVVLAIVALIAIFAILYAKNEGFRTLVNKVFGVLRDRIEEAVTKMGDFLGSVRDKLEGAGEKFGEFRDTARNAIGTYSGDGGGVLGKLHDIVTAFTGLGGTIKEKSIGMWDGLGDSFKSVINKMIGWWNDLSFSINIPNNIPGLPDSFAIDTPNIPTLASGGIVTRPTLAIFGEAGPEAVIPLSRLNGFGGNQTLTVKLDLGADAMAQLERGRRVAADLRAYTSAGGRL